MTATEGPSPKHRLIGLDVLKVAMALLVVCIHANPLRGLWPEGQWLLGNGVARVAVPTFFVIAGFNFRPEVPGRSLRLAGRYLTLHLIWLTLYLPLWAGSVAQGGLKTYVSYWLYGYWQLWFLTALAVALLLASLIWRWRSGALLAVALGLLVAGFAVQTAVVWGLLPTSFHPQARNGLFMGLPFFLLGYLLRREDIARLISFRSALNVAGIGVLGVVAEAMLIRGLSPARPAIASETFLMAAVVGPALVLAAVRAPDLPGLVARLPLGTLSSGIYFIHVAFVVVMIRYLGTPYPLIFPLAVAGSVLVTLVLIRLRLDRRLF